MDGQAIREKEALCIEEQAPACTTTCPLHVDVRAMVEHVRDGQFKRAFEVLARTISFPTIISRVCDHPCESGCRRAEVGAPIKIHALERACVDYGFSAVPLRVQRPQIKRRIAIVGAGLSGLTAALDLHVKGHTVVLFEAASELLPRLRAFDHAILSPEDIAADLERVLISGIEFRLNTPIALDDSSEPNSLKQLVDEFDAVYLGSGPQPVAGLSELVVLDSAQHLSINTLTLATSHAKIFAGGSHRYGQQYSPISSLHDGRYAAISIDRVLQGASLEANRDNQGSYPSRLYVNTSRFTPSEAVELSAGTRAYTQQQAMDEGARCFPCHCLECVRLCPYLEHYGGYPKRYVREIYNNDSILMGQHKSNHMVNSCLLCGLCEAICPNDVSMAEVCLEARESMVDKGKMPTSYHEFALRDMAFSQSDAFSMWRHQPGHQHSQTVFFPGCQLSASSPEHVKKVYDHLCAKLPGGVGLMLGCCGAPAQWAGRKDLFQANQQALAESWNAMGRPRMVTACSTCLSTFKQTQPDIALDSLWTVLDEVGVPMPVSSQSGPKRSVAIHDPCTTRDEEPIRNSVRHILSTIGVEVIELNAPGLSTCCGFGGLASFVNPPVTNKVIDQRIAQSDADYLTYCAMCRDNFARRGKRSLHLLDLLLDSEQDTAARADPGFSRRQENRARLKNQLLRERWGENVQQPEAKLELELSEAVHADIELKLILEDDIRQVIQHAQTTGAKLINPATGHFIASFRPSTITYWVEYTQDGSRYLVHRSYCHRMEVG